MEPEENTILSAEGEQDWPMDDYEHSWDDEWLCTAIRVAQMDHEEYQDTETKLRLNGLLLLQEVKRGQQVE